MVHITLNELLELHVLLIDKYGGSKGVRDLGRLEAAVAVQEQQVFGIELYPTLFEKAAAIMRGVIGDHPFFDGNKRTGTLAALTFLTLNERTFIAKKGEVEDFAVRVATEGLEVAEIAAWLDARCR